MSTSLKEDNSKAETDHGSGMDLFSSKSKKRKNQPINGNNAVLNASNVSILIALTLE